MVRTTDKALQPGAVLESLATTGSGSVALHIGLARDCTAGKPVYAVDLHRTETTHADLEAIEAQTRSKWPEVRDLVIAHRFGRMEPGEIICIVAVSAPHRGEAFDACRFALDRIKELHSLSLIEIGP
jgi:molybdopterin synthase catalytic subunit